MTTDPLLKPYTYNRHQQPWRVRTTQQVREHDGGDPVLEDRARAATRSWRNSLLLRGPPPPLSRRAFELTQGGRIST
jgi:hypothetical protein